MRKLLIKDGWGFLAMAVVAALAASGCHTDPQQITRTTNNGFAVELLFEHNGIKVYRFYDAGRAIYYTDARGAAEWTDGGKHPVLNRVETNR